MSPDRETVEIKEGALFVSDAHENATRHHFHHLLESLDRGEIKTPQLFLMGDMFDLLSSQISAAIDLFSPTIALLDRLGTKIEIHYLEGNHDFNLQSLFPHIRCHPLSVQPLQASFCGKTLLLSHGDLYQGNGYLLFSKIIRNAPFLSLLDLIDGLLGRPLFRKILQNQQNKNLCERIDDFYGMIKQKIKYYDIEAGKIDFVCEGHYHQNVEYAFDELTYINFASFACEPCIHRIAYHDRIVFEAVTTRGQYERRQHLEGWFERNGAGRFQTAQGGGR